MKKTALLLALCLLFWDQVTSAIEFKAKGHLTMSFGYGENGSFQGSYKGSTPTGWGQGQDNFEAAQKMKFQIEAIASESLSGVVQFEIGELYWGQANGGGALGADGVIVQVAGAWLDWSLPHSDIKVRMGLQSLMTPATASGNAVLNDTVAALVVNSPINENISLTAFWARPYNDNYPGWTKNGVSGYRAGYLDNVDAIGLIAPINFDKISLSPWAMYAGIGPNAFRAAVSDAGYPFGNFGNMGGSAGYYMAGMFPAGGARHRDFSDANTAHKLTSYGQAWWAGLSGAINSFEPFSLAFDFEYGSVNWQDNERLNRAGWFATLLAQYNFDWGVPALYGWLSSGDDANPANGSERMPALDPNNSNNYSPFAFDGAPYIERDALIGNNMAGTWGIGASLTQVSFIENLRHSFRVNYMGGTNSPTMAKKMSLAGLWPNGLVMQPNDLGQGAGLGMPGLYMTRLDHALELGTSANYQIYENFAINFEADYIALWLDTSESAWGARHRNNESIPATRDAWNINLSFVYSF